jgi:L-amino acid N-acyltransferase YncA
MTVREYKDSDVADMVRIWNKVVEDGVAFPQEDYLDEESGKAFFAAQSYCGVAEEDGTVKGMYILHPNNIGRCGHIANASYAVDADNRGLHIGELLVKDCLAQAKRLGFKLMQFNAVVAGNIHARHLYERLGFTQIGTVPGGFRLKDGTYSDICLYYHAI